MSGGTSHSLGMIPKLNGAKDLILWRRRIKAFIQREDFELVGLTERPEEDASVAQLSRWKGAMLRAKTSHSSNTEHRTNRSFKQHCSWRHRYGKKIFKKRWISCTQHQTSRQFSTWCMKWKTWNLKKEWAGKTSEQVSCHSWQICIARYGSSERR